MSRRFAYRKKRQNRLGILCVMMVVLMLLVVISVKSVELQEKQESYMEKEAAIQSQIEAEKKRADELVELKKYTSTKKYVEEVAKDKLGLVYEDEIIFQQEE